MPQTTQVNVNHFLWRLPLRQSATASPWHETLELGFCKQPILTALSPGGKQISAAERHCDDVRIHPGALTQSSVLGREESYATLLEGFEAAT